MLSLIPISDANPTRHFPIVTVALIALNVVAFFATPGLGQTQESQRYFFEQAPIACQLDNSCPPGFPFPGEGVGDFLISVVYSTFLHAGFLHIIGNMLFLWVFGNNVEDFLGRGKYLAFYLLGGITASFAHVFWSLATSPDICTPTDFSACVPSVGASGAVAAVMGAYLLLYPRARVNVLVPIFIFFVVQMSAVAVLVIWFVYQFLIAYQDIVGITEVAWAAHVGGFIFGFIGILILGGRPHRPTPILEPHWRY